jgi:glycosyltransferase involved in cell wall biosynthesis
MVPTLWTEGGLSKTMFPAKRLGRHGVYRVALLCSESPGRIDAIRAYSLRLAAALRGREGISADVYLRTPDGRWSSGEAGPVERRDLLSGLRAYDAVVLQYNPFMYGRWGFAPWLPVSLATFRRRSGPKIALMIHEPYVPMIGWRWVLMGTWQRAQLFAIRLLSDVVAVSIETWTADLRALRPRRPTHHLPVGSNLPDRREARNAQRARLEIGDRIVLATMSSGHPSRRVEYITAAANAVAENCGATVLLNLGAGAPRLDGLAEAVEVHSPGRLTEEDLAAHVATADIFLAPFIDGVSTRRGSMMAALQHGVAVIGTDGRLTDSVLRGAINAIRLVPIERGDDFADAAVRLAADDEARSKLGQEGRRLYELSFDWPVVAAQLTAVLTDAKPR